MKLTVIALILLAIVATSKADNVSAFSFAGYQSQFSIDGGFHDAPFQDGVFGYSFSTTSEITVSALSFFDADADGLLSSHRIGLWTSNGSTLLAEATVLAGTTSPILDSFRYATLSTPLVLSAGTSYLVGGTIAASPAMPNTTVHYDRLVWNTNATAAPGVVWNQARVGFVPTFGSIVPPTLALPPLTGPVTSPGYFGGSFVLSLAREPSLRDILRNSITIDSTAGGMINATFTPNLDFNLSEVATRFGFDHFNFYQEITGFHTDGADAQAVQAITQFFSGRGLGVDPLLGGNPGHEADLFLPYWDEVPIEPGYSISENTSANTFVFYSDAPNLVYPGITVDFSTYLIGVRSDGTVVAFRDIEGTSFKWSYEQTSLFAGGVISDITLANIDPARAGGGSSASGGFLTDADWSDGREARLETAGIDVIPEPASCAFLLVGSIFCLFRRPLRTNDRNG